MITTVLATAVALCFIWSVILFFSAVAFRAQEQEDGFGWALAGAALFVVTFADRLPGSPMWVREVLTILPGVSSGAQLFGSSVVALGLLLVVYGFRIGVFYELVLRDPDADGLREDRANDKVAPALSYYSFAICLVALVQPLYGLTPAEVVLCVLVLLVAYYGGVLPRLLHFLQDFWTELKLLWERLREGLELVVQGGMLAIAWGEEFRRGARAPGRVEAQREKIVERRERATKRREEIIKKVADGPGADAGSRWKRRSG